MEEGMMYREPVKVREVVECKPAEVEKQERVPHQIIIEKGKRVAYTKSGDKIEFGTTDEKMITREMAFYGAYPEEFEKVYGHLREVEDAKENNELERMAEQDSDKLMKLVGRVEKIKLLSLRIGVTVWRILAL
jgi:hypothetical protein